MHLIEPPLQPHSQLDGQEEGGDVVGAGGVVGDGPDVDRYVSHIACMRSNCPLVK